MTQDLAEALKNLVAAHDAHTGTHETANDLCEAWKVARAVLASPEPFSLDGVREQLAEDSGFWRTCSGCHESEDGYDVGHYPYSPTFNCKLGAGCLECGGLGVVWDKTDYEDFVRFVQAEDEAEETAKEQLQKLSTPRPLSEWGEEDGNVLWWRFPIEEPPFFGSPLLCGRKIRITVDGNETTCMIDGWPGYHTHWTPAPPMPMTPPAPHPPTGEEDGQAR